MIRGGERRKMVREGERDKGIKDTESHRLSNVTVIIFLQEKTIGIKTCELKYNKK